MTGPDGGAEEDVVGDDGGDRTVSGPDGGEGEAFCRRAMGARYPTTIGAASC